MKQKIPSVLAFGMTVVLVAACSMELQPKKASGNKEMIRILKSVKNDSFHSKNIFCPEARLPYLDSLLADPNSTTGETRHSQYQKAIALLELGREEEAIRILERLTKDNTPYLTPGIRKTLAVAYLRQGERSNCIANHAAESCILPIQGLGIHQDQDGSRKAIGLYQDMLKTDPDNLEARWLLNVAYMTLGEYPQHVPAKFLLPDMQGDTTVQINAFQDIAGDLKLDVRNMAGGSIADDFNNDGYLDLITSGWGLADQMHFFVNNANGTFNDVTDKSGLKDITGGLNLMQADYDNDGNKDVLVLRGAWKRDFGKEPNSLLKNNGDGTFTDVTTSSGLLSFHPTQTATWNDFNNDGWIDLFIGNETVIVGNNEQHPCELYINNQDGTFREVARQAHCDVLNYVKGVASGDYDNDGWKDIFVSTMDGERKLLKNRGLQQKEIVFENVTKAAGLAAETGNTFPTWFWDYDNDGWLDIFACDYTFEKSLAYYAAAEKLNIAAGNPEKMLLYRNNHDGTFTNIANEVGLNKNVFAMGSNFGDIDNDGFLDMYLGSGNPLYQSLVPNKMFQNIGGKTFADVTASARVGHLQKGHGVSFADMDNDGDQDIYIEMGGAYVGDSYQNSFFLNPGQKDNNRWIDLTLEGTTSNRTAIGTRVKVTFKEKGIVRSVYRDVNSGGSFGASPLRREIGVGQAEMIDQIEIRWHGSGKVQVFSHIKPNQFLKITEGSDEIESVHLNAIQWVLPDRLCYPMVSKAKKN
ncbi:Repeat domain-containing protein [Chryseolinea serpens]|uniref:Repeat domain-containing protein n=1 Tax=Chryseolinea serpens TaxID=947013 RepID=A0A1M5MC19_9BACT|nr:CRTAC1 family protein [Chryseolinea serpens]SHG74816.1 Repeat domain-containing protein [Chryseolinea serpens]